MTESELLACVRREARKTGWRYYHTHVPIGSPPGFPDVFLLRRPRIVIAELKGPRPKWYDAQREWLSELSLVAGDFNIWTAEGKPLAALLPPRPSIEVYAWNPDDWPHTIVSILAPDDDQPGQLVLP